MMYVPPERFSPRRLMDWILQKMEEGNLSPAMKELMHDTKRVNDYSSLAMYLHESSNPATEIADFFTSSALVEFFNDEVIDASGKIEKIDFADTGIVYLTGHVRHSTNVEEILKEYFSRYLESLYNQYFGFKFVGAYRDFQDVKQELEKLQKLVRPIETLSTSRNTEDFRSKLTDAERSAGLIGKRVESILNNFFYIVREVNMRSRRIDILKRYKEKHKKRRGGFWNWSQKEKTLKKFAEDPDGSILPDLRQVVSQFLSAYSVTDEVDISVSESIEIMTEQIRKCRNKSAHEKLGLDDIRTFLGSVVYFISRVEPVVPRCCFVLRAKLSPWITVLELRVEGEESTKEALYLTREFEKYTCFFKYEDIVRASENYELFFALPTTSDSHNQYFIVPYGKINSKGKVEYQHNFGYQDALRKLGITVELSQDTPIEYIRIRDRELA